MKTFALPVVVIAGFALACFSGCGGSDSEKTTPVANEGSSEGESSKSEIKKYDIADLPPVDEPLQRPLDGGRLELCPPADWGFFPQAKYLIVFAQGKVSELPRITVASSESPYGKEETTEENATDLVAAIRKKLESDKNKFVREKPKPVMLGGRVWVRHVRQVSQGGTPCAVQSLQIIRDGRLYTLEAFSAAKDDSQANMAAAVSKIRDIVYAVAANAKFAKESSAPAATEEKPSEKAPETKPAETSPVETKPAAETPAEKPAEPK